MLEPLGLQAVGLAPERQLDVRLGASPDARRGRSRRPPILGRLNPSGVRGERAEQRSKMEEHGDTS